MYDSYTRRFSGEFAFCNYRPGPVQRGLTGKVIV